MRGSLLSSDHLLGKVQWAFEKMRRSDVCFACLAWLDELLVGMLILLMNSLWQLQ